MKQVLQSARTGKMEVAEVPMPAVLPGCVLVRIAASLVSAGTERAASEFASKSLLQKARSRPDLVREVVNKIRREGLLSATAAVNNRLHQPSTPGYSSAGTVIEVGEGIADLKPGDRVACAGANYAVHAEYAAVPRMLTAKIPSPNVEFESAAFTTLGAIALHGVRVAEAKLGDVVAVIGLGLLGQLALQILKAAGCRVIGFDIAPSRAELATQLGCPAATASEGEFRNWCLEYSGGHGADSILITAETPSSDPVNLASQVARDRGIVVAVGTIGMELQRRLYYEKELDFRVSRSYGPGRYDAAFEQKGRDYPIGYVRWSETRNMEAFLQLLATGAVNVHPLITHRFAIEDALSAYDLITGRAQQPYLGVLIGYSETPAHSERRLELLSRKASTPASTVRVGVLGAGNFATGILIPAIRSSQETALEMLCATSGARARSAAEKLKFAGCTTDESDLFDDPRLNTVVIATRHHLHANQVQKALAAGKHVFCEKPLCLRAGELEEIRRAYSERSGQLLMVGFNRRFSPLARRMKAFVDDMAGPVVMHYRVNAGSLPADHWLNDPEQGGGRILGEACHFVDFFSFLCGAAPVAVEARSLTRPMGDPDVIASIEFADGSYGTLEYVCSGDRVFGKERVEVFGGAAVAVLDDFRRLELVRHGKKQVLRSRLRQDKGHRAEWESFATAIRNGGPAPIPFEDICATTLATISIAESLRCGQTAAVPELQESISITG